MKRLMTKEISGCDDCRFFVVGTEFASHFYGCFIRDISTSNTDGSREENEIVKNQLSDMFKNCSEWEEVS